jgi:hypothetical protein
MSKSVARKKWDDECNYFKADAKSTWKYKPFANRKPTVDDIVAIVYKNKLYKKTVKSGKVTIYNKCYRTYIYRELVAGEIFDGNKKAYTSNYDGRGTGNWKDADNTIDEYNKKFVDTPMFIQDGYPPKSSGKKKDTPEQIMNKLMKAAGLKD